jgi:DNA-binding TFAR19-related protein (PDSD5 family)
MVLGAMLENDDDLVDLIREMQQAKGRGDKFNPKRLHEKIEVIGPSIDLDELRRGIDVEIVDRLGMGWDHWYGLLERFHNREGHCRVAQKHEEEGLKLGNWVAVQRRIKNQLSPDQLRRLNSLGFSWDPLAEQWEENFTALQKFHKREGHCRVVRNLEEKGDLGTWVCKQRSKKDELAPDRLERLNSLGFSWDPHSEQWEENFAALQKFREREGHCRVAPNHKEEGLKVGNWVVVQRTIKNQLSPDQLERLNSLGFRWDPFAEQWEQGFAALQKFREREGHCRVVRGYIEGGQNLGAWVGQQRSKKDELAPDRLERLNSLGFRWDPHSEQWEQGFAALQKFHEREGHCCVVKGHEEDGLKLGFWANRQRDNKAQLSPDRIERLNSLGFSWDRLAEQWEQGFAALRKFHKREGHCRVPYLHQEDRVKLNIWLNTQRAKKDKLTPDRLERLNSLGFSWDPTIEQWEENFAALQKFHEREGHCRVAHNHEQEGLKLGNWVGFQRSKKDKLTPDQLERLNSLGFSWDPRSEQWEQGFAALQKFHEREGHCRVPAKRRVGGLNLGGWVRKQRAIKNQLSPDRLNRLNSIGFSWDSFSEFSEGSGINS